MKANRRQIIASQDKSSESVKEHGKEKEILPPRRVKFPSFKSKWAGYARRIPTVLVFIFIGLVLAIIGWYVKGD